MLSKCERTILALDLVTLGDNEFKDAMLRLKKVIIEIERRRASALVASESPSKGGSSSPGGSEGSKRSHSTVPSAA